MEKHTTHAINLRTKRTIPILLDILRYFLQNDFFYKMISEKLITLIANPIIKSNAFS